MAAGKVHTIRQKGDAKELGARKAAEFSEQPEGLKILNLAQVLALKVPPKEKLVQDILPFRGAVLLVGESKAGKSLLAVQIAIAVASGKALFGFYNVEKPGAALIVEQDDPGGAGSIKGILDASPLRREPGFATLPIQCVEKANITFGSTFTQQLRTQIVKDKLHLVVLDSYTAMRGERKSNDIVKIEQTELRVLDELAHETGCTVIVVHHGSKTAAGAHWTQQQAGTFAMSAATEALIHISRFADLDDDAPERLVQVRGRSLAGTAMVLKLQKETLDYFHVMEGAASNLYPVVESLRSAFGQQPFTPAQYVKERGTHRATAHRHIERLLRAGILIKDHYGEYRLRTP